VQAQDHNIISRYFSASSNVNTLFLSFLSHSTTFQTKWHQRRPNRDLLHRWSAGIANNDYGTRKNTSNCFI